MEDICLLVDLLLGIASKRIGSDVIVDFLVADLALYLIVVVEEFHSGTHTCLIVALNRS